MRRRRLRRRLGSGPGSEAGDDALVFAGHPTYDGPSEESWRGAPLRRVPSLAPPSEVAALVAGAVQPRDLNSEPRVQLAAAEGAATMWGWHGTRGDGAGRDPVVQLFRRAWHLETSWAPGGVVERLAAAGWARALCPGAASRRISSLGR